MEEAGLTELSNALPINEESAIVHVEICQSPTRLETKETLEETLFK